MILAINTFLVTFLITCIAWLLAKRRQKKGEPPIEWYWIPYIGSGLKYKKDPIAFLRKCEKRHGPIFTLYMGGKYFTFVLDPFTHPLIAKASKILCFRVHTTPMVKQIFDFTRRDSTVRTMGGLLPKYFQGAGLDHLVAVMMGNLQSVISEERFSQRQWKEMSLYKFCWDIMFEAGFKTLFGTGENKAADPRMEKMIKDFITFDNAFPYLAQGYPISSLEGAQEARKEFWKILTPSRIEERKDSSHIFHEHRDNNNNMDETLAKEFFGLLFAAESNTVLATFWAIYFLLKHPDAYKAAKEEIDHILEETAQDNIEKHEIHFSRADMAKMIVLDSIIKETFRLRVSPAMLRQAVDDCNVNVATLGKSFQIRKGDKVLVLYQMTHYDPEIYEDAHLFKYDRFLNEDGSPKTEFYKNGKLVRYHLQPFGSGLSKCPGRYWATTELKQFLALSLLRFDMELIDPQRNVEALTARIAMGTLTPSCDSCVRFKCAE